GGGAGGRGPRSPPPPPPPDRSCASLTFRVRPCSSRPFRSVMAFCASAGELISTKPKPRERPVARSVMTAADSQVPTSPKSDSRSALVVEKERFPTNSFLPIPHSCPHQGGVWILSPLPEREADRRTNGRGRAQTKRTE